MTAVRLNIPKVESQRLSDLHQIGKVETDAVEQDRGHDNLVDSPHVFSLGGVVGLPPSELDSKLSRVIWQFYRDDPKGKKVKIQVILLP